MAPQDDQRTRPPRHEVRARLLEAATAVFAERGIDGASLDDVAAVAGLTKGAIYSNFSSKDDLIYALMDAHVARRESLAVAALRSEPGEPPAAAARIGDALAGALISEPEWQRLFLDFWSRAQRDERLREAFAARRAEARAEVAALIAGEAERRDVELPLPPADLAVTLLALSNGLAIERLTDPAAVPADLFGRLLALVLADGA